MLLFNKNLVFARSSSYLSFMNFSQWKATHKNNDIYLTPQNQKPTETLILLHGLGDTARGWEEIFYSAWSPVLDVSTYFKFSYDFILII